MKKILLLEFGDSHTETIHSTVSLLAGSGHVTLVIHAKSIDKISSQTPLSKIYPLDPQKRLSEALRYIREIQPELIILNSAQGRIVRDFCLRTLFDKIPVVGFHHNPANLYSSFTQKIINWKIKKYLVLADFIVEHLVAKGLDRDRLHAVYPVYYPDTLTEQSVSAVHAPIIAIPGVLEQDRRDYFGLIDVCIQHRNSLSQDTRFVLLGNAYTHDGPEIRKRVIAAGLESYFQFYDSYVSNKIVFDTVRYSKFVMPLLHPGTKWFSMYFETKISGAYNLAYAFQKPLLMHEIFKLQKEFQPTSIFYNTENLLNKISQESLLVSAEFYKKFDFDVQQKKLVEFLIP